MPLGRRRRRAHEGAQVVRGRDVVRDEVAARVAELALAVRDAGLARGARAAALQQDAVRRDGIVVIFCCGVVVAGGCGVLFFF